MPRTILTWNIRGEALVGTCHLPAPAEMREQRPAESVGILLLNPGAAPRSGNSDLSVRIADRLAGRGFPVFRFDLAGLGDSSGRTPADVDAYVDEVLEGRNDATTAALIERIRREFGIARIVVGGLCAAAVPAVRALRCASVPPAGLILLEPAFRRAARRASDPAQTAARIGRLERCAVAARRALTALGLDGDNRGARALRPARSLARRLLNRWGGPRLPGNVNAELVAGWRTSFGRGVHSLVVVAAGQDVDQCLTQILESAPSRSPGSVACVRVPDTNHLFTSGAGRETLLAALERWVVERFGGGSEARLRPAHGIRS